MNRKVNQLTSYFQKTIAKLLPFLLLLLVVFFSFAKLSDQPVHQWDEARTGINAIEMLQNGDWINLHFGGQPDKIRAKPPLVVWWVAANFSIFGYNSFSLRLHSAIASVFIFFFIYQITRLYKPSIFAAGVILILLSVRGILGFHVGRTGDFDAVLLAFLLAGLYAFLLYLDFGRQKAIYAAAIAWGLAFYTKGPAMGILFPGVFIYTAVTGRLVWIVRQKKFYLALLLCSLFPVSWYLVLHYFGVQLENPEVSGKNAFERMFLYDLRDRFTETNFEGKREQADPLFLWHCLSENFALWHYLFFVVLAGGMINWIRNKISWQGIQKKRLLILSIAIWIPIGGLLSVVTVAKFWYFAPALPFVAITLVYGVEFLSQRLRWVIILFLFFWVFAMYFRYFGAKPKATEGSKTDDFFTPLIEENKERIRTSDTIMVVPPLPAQRVLLELYFTNPNVVYEANPQKSTDQGLLFSRSSLLDSDPALFLDFKMLANDENYVILE